MHLPRLVLEGPAAKEFILRLDLTKLCRGTFKLISESNSHGKYIYQIMNDFIKVTLLDDVDYNSKIIKL